MKRLEETQNLFVDFIRPRGNFWLKNVGETLSLCRIIILIIILDGLHSL